MTDDICPRCGVKLELGMWPLCGDSKNDHGKPQGMHTFTPYVDEHISVDGKPVVISSYAQKQRLLKKHWYRDREVQMVERDFNKNRQRTR